MIGCRGSVSISKKSNEPRRHKVTKIHQDNFVLPGVLEAFWFNIQTETVLLLPV